MDADRRLTFEGFSLDLANEQLVCDGEVVALTPKAFAVLRRLVEDNGKLVTKAELLHAGWADTHVTDGVLKVSILEIRRALGDDSGAPRFIETVPRRGYRFIAPRTRMPTVAPRADASAEPIGRAGLLAELEARLECARAGQRQLVFLAGEAGIGKTTVLDAFVARAGAEPDVMIARGACLEHYGAAEAYLPVLEALGRLLREPGSDRVIRLLERYAPTWVVQLPWLARPDDREALRRDLVGATKERMLREMSEALEALTAETMLVLVLEDLHWSDYSTLDLLGMLGRREEPARLLVLGSYRPVDVIVTGHPLRSLLQELRVRRQCEDIALEFLREADIAAYLGQRFHTPSLPPELARAVHQRTDGNPLFMVRVVDELVTLGVLVDQDGHWRLVGPLDEIASAVPESLRQLIDKQIGRLDLELQQLLEVGSVLGNEFTVPSLAAGLDANPLAVEDRCETLAAQEQFLAASAPFVRADGTAVARYRFSHSLYPQALIKRVGAGRRLRLHQRLGEWLEQTYGAQAGVVESQMARHFEEAHDYRRAIAHLRRAADGDVRRWAYGEAVALLTHAVALADRLPAADADAMYPVLLDQLCRVRRGLGDMHATLQTLDTLAAWARTRGEPTWEARAVLYRATVLAWVDAEASRAAAIDGMALSERVDDPVVRADAESHAIYWRLQDRGCRIGDMQLAEAAVGAAAAAGDREILAQSKILLALVQRCQADFRQAARTALEGIEIARDAGNAYTYLFSHCVRVDALVQLGEWGAAFNAIDEGLRMANQSGHVHLASFLRSEAAALHSEAFDFTSAAAIAREELQRPSLTDRGRQSAMFALAFALLGLGRLDEAYSAFTAPQLVWAPEVASMAWPEQIHLRHGLGQVGLARGDLDGARREAEAFQALAATADEPMPRALAARLLAEIALEAGRLSEAEGFLREALAAIQGREAPVVAWRIAATAARVHGRQRRRAEAEAARRQSAALVTRLADSLPPGHELRQSFLKHPSVREVLDSPRTASRPRHRP